MENINTDTNNQRPNPVLRLELDTHTLAFLSLSKLMDHPPSVVEELTDLERHLLVRDLQGGEPELVAAKRKAE